MAKNILRASQAKSAKCKSNGKPKKHNDGEGLYLICFKSGLKSWRYDYTFNDKRQTLTYGSYPDFSLSAVRELHSDSLVLRGKGPIQQNKSRNRSTS